jgi:hypothetical protein
LLLGYDEIEEGLVLLLSIGEANVLMQTCRSMFITVFHALVGARVLFLKRPLVTFQCTIDRAASI